ncbi:MAG: hypothetical protein CMG74_11805 [Candidatus Marinimicrobia bacterium]|nr:hypothetical protein [Candidatus Neomarinimicrobiota bacterium]
MDTIATANFTQGTDTISFDESELINGAIGTKAITTIHATTVNTNAANTSGVFVFGTDFTLADGLSDAATKIAAAAQNETADDAFIFVMDNGTNTYVIAWDDRAANGGDGGGDVDAAELQILLVITGASDATAGYAATGDFLLY